MVIVLNFELYKQTKYLTLIEMQTILNLLFFLREQLKDHLGVQLHII